MSQHRVLIVYRQPIFRDLIKALLATEPDIEVVDAVGMIDEAADRADATAPETVIIDSGHRHNEGLPLPWPFGAGSARPSRIIILDLADTGMTILSREYITRVTPAELAAAVRAGVAAEPEREAQVS